MNMEEHGYAMLDNPHLPRPPPRPPPGDLPPPPLPPNPLPDMTMLGYL